MTNKWNPWTSDDSRLKDHHYYLVTHTGFDTPMKAKYHQELDAFEIIGNPTTCAYKWDRKVLAWRELPEIYRESEGEMSDKYKREIEILLSSLPTPKFNPKEYIWVLGSKVIDSLWRECNEYLRVATELKMLCGIEVHEGRDYGDEAIMLLRDVTKIQNAESEEECEGI